MGSTNVSDFKDSTDIAIIGIAGRFPGAKNVDEFWCNLRNGVESITRFSDQELLEAGVDPAVLKDPNYVKAGAILGDIRGFDADFFGLTPREAQVLDPQHRLFLETTWNAIEKAGYDPTAYDGAIGMFAGVALSEYLLNNLYPNRALWKSGGELAVIHGNDKDSLTTRVAYLLDLTGPCCTVQTYCSTSLVAVCLACESLLSGESDMVLAGGVMAAVPQIRGYYYQEGGVASPDGRCRAFDAKAKGSPLGSGVAVVLLKRLQDAVADGDTIYAVIKGWAVNNDGALRTGYTAPGVRGQASVILEALADAGVDAESIGYIEAHGTGTALGDAVEFAALVKAFTEHTDAKRFCAVGSVKTNVGHLDRAAGATGLIKTALALKHKLILPSLNYEEPNPEIDFSNTSFYVNTELRDWVVVDGHPRRAGVSSFGMGGTNAHVVLEEAPYVPFDELVRPYQLLLLSAKTATALDTAAANLCEHLRQHPDTNMADVAYTLQVGRKAFEHRRILVCRGRDDALRVLGEGDATRLLNGVQPTQERPVAFMFSGVGDHYAGMTQELYQLEPVFRETVDHCCDLLQPILSVDLRDVLYPAGTDIDSLPQGLDLRQMLGRGSVPRSAADERLSQAHIAQPAVFVVEYALAQLLRAWGIVPDALVGYSLGEYVAACVAGVLSLEDALRLVAERARMIQRLPEGNMLAVSLSESQVQPFLNSQICLAVVNGPTTCVLAGPVEALQQLERQLTDQGIGYRCLGISRAVHSTMMKPIAAELTALVQTFQLNPPQIPCLSNVTGDWITDDEATSPAYWARHLCQTVRFGDGLAKLLAHRRRILIEVGPGQSLSSFAKQHPGCTKEQLSHILPTLRYVYDRQPDLAFLLNTLGKLWLTGFQVGWSGFYGGERRQRIPLPTYPFERQYYWIDPPAGMASTLHQQQAATGKRPDIADWFYEPTWEEAVLPDASGEIGGPWLIFADSLGWGTAIGQRLSQKGASVVWVREGETFGQPADDVFTVRPDTPADYRALLDALKASGKMPTQIVHVWSIDDLEDRLVGEEACQVAQRLGFYSLVYLAQAIGAQSTAQALQITVLTNDMQPVGEGLICPEKATVLGPCRVIPQEYQTIRCRAIDVVLPTGDDGAGERLVSQLVAELIASMADVTVAYRAGIRYVQRFVPRRLTLEPTDTQLRPGGVYLITGGLGKVGLILAEYLGRCFQAKLVLISRSGMPARGKWDDWLVDHPDDDPTSRRIQSVQRLESLGAEVLVLAADVANEGQMEAALAQTYERFGDLNGVIHAAGLTDLRFFSSIHELDRDTCEAHFLAKVYGLYVLENVLQGRDLDFCVLFSSVSSVLGGLGFAAYAAANSFMEVYVHSHNRTRSSNWISVAWDTWEVDRRESEFSSLGATLSEFVMTPEEGVQAFALAVASEVTQLVNSTGDLDARIRQWVMLESLQGKGIAQATHSRPDLTTEYVPPSSDYQRQVAAIWQDVLGIAPIGIYDNFFELGGHSLVALQVMSQLQQVFQVHLALSVLLMTPTVNKLAIAVEMAVIEKLESLTEEEAADLMEKM